MARGDLTIFEEARAVQPEGGWEPADTFNVAILDDTSTPTAADTTPALGDCMQVGSGGTYAMWRFFISALKKNSQHKKEIISWHEET